MPENSMPLLDQLRSASVHHNCVLLANQSGNTYIMVKQLNSTVWWTTLTVNPGQTWPIYSLPSGFVMNTFCSTPRVYGSYLIEVTYVLHVLNMMKVLTMSVLLICFGTAASTMGMSVQWETSSIWRNRDSSSELTVLVIWCLVIANQTGEKSACCSTHKFFDELFHFVCGETNWIGCEISNGMIKVNIIPHHWRHQPVRTHLTNGSKESLPSNGILASRIFWTCRRVSLTLAYPHL